MQLRKFGREQSPGLYTHRYRKKQDYSCEKVLTIRSHGMSIDETATSADERTYLQNSQHTQYHTPQKKRANSCVSDDTADGGGRGFEEEAEVLELVLRFLGTPGKIFYQSALMLLMFVGLVAYVQVFVSTFISQLWPGVPPMLPSLLFGLVAVPLSCVDLAEQISVQVLMSVLRFVSLGILLLGTLAAVYCNPSQDSYSVAPLFVDSPSDESPLPLVNKHGFGLMFTTAIFSQLFQHSVPGLIRPLPTQGKKHVSSIFGLALVTTGTIYITTGVICVYYFGPFVNQAINLNFVGFDWGVSSKGLPLLAAWGIKACAMTVVLFPALDTLSVFPLIANTLGSNLHAALPHAHRGVLRCLDMCLPSSAVTSLLQAGAGSSVLSRKETARQFTARLWRLAAAVPPIVLSMYVTDLSLTLQLAGICGILVALVTPALLQRVSLEQLQDIPGLENGPPHLYIAQNPYATVFSRQEFTYAILFLATVALWICCYQIIDAIFY